MAGYIGPMVIPVLTHVYSVLAWIFQKPKTRVRKTNGIIEIGGTVEKTMRNPMTEGPGYVEYWTVEWDDEPGIWQTYAAYKFQWIDRRFTLVDFKM